MCNTFIQIRQQAADFQFERVVSCSCDESKSNISVDALNLIKFDHLSVEDIAGGQNFKDIDPDLNFFLNEVSKQCNYVMEDEVCNLDEAVDSFSMYSLNINNLPKKFSYFKDLLFDDPKNNFDFVGVCETKLDSNIDHLFSIHDYCMYKLNTARNSGGIAVYLNNKHINHFQRTDLTFNFNYLEALFIELKLDTGSILVGMIYRRPNTNVTEFINKMGEILDIVAGENKKCYILGDFNLDLAKYNISNPVNDLVSLFTSYNLFCSINRPTRVSDSTASIIDHIWTNDITHLIKAGIIHSEISDHFPIFSSFKTKSNTEKGSQKVAEYRDFSLENIYFF